MNASQNADMTPGERAQLAKGRAVLYGLLHACWTNPDAPLVGTIRSGALLQAFEKSLGVLDGAAFATGLALLRTFAMSRGSLDAEALRLELAPEYNRLFVGPLHVVAPPYESVYQENVPELERGSVLGAPSRSVVAQYRAAGLDLAETFTDLPDHIAVELHFMAALCHAESQAWEQQDAAFARRCVQRQQYFLSHHLAAWTGKCCARVIDQSASPFYQSVAHLTQSFIDMEQDTIGAWANWVQAA